MSPKVPLQAPYEGALQRGKACLSCRRRKMKCDGERPHCTQCIRGNRADDCEYTDNQGRTRTQMLEEHVALLQARIHELEDPRIASQSVRLHDPYIATRTPGAQNPRPPNASWWESEEPPAQITDMLVGTFMPHAPALGFALCPVRFLSNLRLPTNHPDKPHPALLHAVFLWALHLSKCNDFMQYENLYLQRSILALQDALGNEVRLEDWMLARRRVHAIQAEVLLARYFFSLGRLLEGRYHANAAVSLAVSSGLHSLRLLSSRGSSESSSRSKFGRLELVAPRDELEYGERVRVFWAVYVLDRCWSAVLDVPCVLTDDAALGTQIDSDWPLEIGDYERLSGNPSGAAQSDRTIQRFLSGEPPKVRDDGSPSQETFRVMASAVYERATRLSHQWFSQLSSKSSSRLSLRTEIQSIARLTMQFARRLTPVDQLSVDEQEGQVLLVVHALAHASMLTLHRVKASEAPAGDMSAINSALVHATEIVQIIEKFGEEDSAPINPILAVLGFSAAQIFAQEEQRMYQISERRELSPTSSNRFVSLRASIARITEALRRCSGSSDTGDIFSQQVDKLLEITGDQ
ncbi:uncharacterized protein FOMMEDRAFT_157780 [Fomitiporia mediterranea MF3/22]|uniref:uncharacterized protein n=1 Tax=Fomitiporia mediterranea (strain MF3/22) TaxID=694068 RepID=UPI000440767D|nr:uncharacterized protein FOMMEDRAFT_157780 [Fomitiporia mediterranea MF3/22]EJD02546.1 hypothetical protein FOMMEDRAFT_157780 [Fomitiporia mediterranea MF3/22]